MKNPKYSLREKVTVTVKSHVSENLDIQQDLEFFVCGVKMTSDAKGQVFVYDLCRSLPDACYNGKGFMKDVKEENIH